MIKALRKKHLQIGMAMLVLLPAGIIAGWKSIMLSKKSWWEAANDNGKLQTTNVHPSAA